MERPIMTNAVVGLKTPKKFIPLEQETRPTVDTASYSHYMHIAEQTARIHACRETGPIRPIRIPGSAKLHWPTAEIRRVLGVTSNQKGFSTLKYLVCIVGVALLIQSIQIALSGELFAVDWAGAFVMATGVVGNSASPPPSESPDDPEFNTSRGLLTMTNEADNAELVPIGGIGLHESGTRILPGAGHDGATTVCLSDVAAIETHLPLNGGQIAVEKQRKFVGTNDTQYLQVIFAMMRRPLSDVNLQSLSGCKNSSVIVSNFRAMGLTITCDRIEFLDNDGNPFSADVFSFPDRCKRMVSAWLVKRKTGGAT
jgi:hypothetical protein